MQICILSCGCVNGNVMIRRFTYITPGAFLWVWPGWRAFTAPDCSLQYRLIILDMGIGTKTGKGRWLWQHTDHSAGSLFLCSAACCLQDYLTLTLRLVQIKGCGLFYLLRVTAECHSELTTSWEMVACGMRPVRLSSGSLCHFV